MSTLRRLRTFRFRPALETLESRLVPAPPALPRITEPSTDGRLVSPFDVHMETGPFSDPDPGDFHAATNWEIRLKATDELVWSFRATSGPLLVHTHLGDGTFMGTHAGRRDLIPERDYLLRASHQDNRGEASPFAERRFRTSPVLIGDPDQRWAVRQPGYLVEIVARDFRLPINIAFVPNSGRGASAPFYYVTELYGAIKVVSKNGTVSTYAGGDPVSFGGPPGASLLNFNPTGTFPGSGEQGLAGIAVDPVSGDVFASMMYSQRPFDDTSPHFGRVVRFHSTDGGRTASSQEVIFDIGELSGFSVPLEAQGLSHQISNVTIGPDGKLYVHNGEGFDVSRAQSLNSFGGKILRMNLDGSPVPDNPFFTDDGVHTSRDYIFASGFRNPFGGEWRVADGKHYTVENGPDANDRLSQLVRGRNYLWDGTAASMANFAAYNWTPPQAPVNIAFVQPETFSGSGFPDERQGRAYVSLSGPTYAPGPQGNGKRIHEFVLDADGNAVGSPTTLIEYVGTGRSSIVGLAAGLDGLYFTDLYRDDGVGGPAARGSNVYRIKFVGAADFTADVTAGPSAPFTVQFTDRSTVPDASEYFWDFGDGTHSSEPNPTKVYTQEGIYTVTLTVTGPRGVRDVVKRDHIGVGRVGFKAEYFNNPVPNLIPNQAPFFTNVPPAVTRIDPMINLTPGLGSAIPGVINADNYSVRWTGRIRPPAAGAWTFRTISDDGVRLWVNNRLLINNWTTHGDTTDEGTITLDADVDYDIKLEYFDGIFGSRAQLFWSGPGQPTFVLVPAAAVTPASRNVAVTPPSNLRLRAGTGTEVGLSWFDESDNETGFQVERSTDGRNFTVVATVGADVTTFDDRPAGGTYAYRVRAFNPFGDSLTTNTVTVLFRVPTITSITRSAYAIEADGTLTINVAFTNPSGQAHTATVVWGDGTPDTTLPLDAGVFSFTTDHSYRLGGSYEIRVTVQTDEGVGDTIVLGASALAATPPAGLLSWWTGDGSHPRTAPDIAGTNPGTLTNGVTYAPGLVGNAFRFNGVNQFVSVARQVQDSFTLMAWINTSAPSLTGTQYFQGNGLIYADVPGPANDFGTAILNGRFAFGTGNPDTTVQSTSTVTTGTWVHVAAVRNRATGLIEVYVNGVREGFALTGNTARLDAPPTITIGGNTIDGRFYNGLIDEVQIFDRALTPEEILAIFDAGGEGLVKGVRVVEVARLRGFIVSDFPPLTPAGHPGELPDPLTRGDAPAILPPDYLFTAAAVWAEEPELALSGSEDAALADALALVLVLGAWGGELP